MLFYCGVGEDSWEYHRLQGNLKKSILKEISPGYSLEGDAKAETLVLWPPHVKSWLTGKDSDAGRDWGHKEKGTTEDEMAGWHHWLNGRESEELWDLVMDREAWHTAIHGAAKSRTGLRDWTELNLELPFFGIGMKTDFSQFCGHCSPTVETLPLLSF